ncbi:MAG: DUF1491 family protein [Thalassobaculales bacterium]
MEDRLPTDFWLMAQLRRLNAEGRPAFVLRRGDARGGSVVVKINLLGPGCRVLTQARDAEGRPGWLGALGGELVPEAEADAYISRAVARDADLWVIEVEDRDGRNPLEGKLL